MLKMCSLQGAAVDVLLIRERTEIHVTSVLDSYLKYVAQECH